MTIPSSVVLVLIFGIFVSIALPILAWVVLHKKTKAAFLPFALGCIVWPVFVLLLESGAIKGLTGIEGFNAFLESHPLIYPLFAGLMAGVFEETGRFIAFLMLRKADDSLPNAISYGLGHGGIEAALLVGLTYLFYLISIFQVSGGATTTLATPTPEGTAALIESFSNTPAYSFLFAIFERLMAMTLHVALSVLVWMSVSQKGKFLYFPLAIFLHMMVDAVVVFISRAGAALWQIELSVAVMLAIVVAITVLLYRKSKREIPYSS